MRCKECDIDIDEDEVFVDRDGDVYDPETNFWFRCPYCFEVLDEDEDV